MIQLEFTIEEVNTILNSLSKRPYEEVFQLINKVQQQAQGQLATNQPETANSAS